MQGNTGAAQQQTGVAPTSGDNASALRLRTASRPRDAQPAMPVTFRTPRSRPPQLRHCSLPACGGGLRWGAVRAPTHPLVLGVAPGRAVEGRTARTRMICRHRPARMQHAARSPKPGTSWRRTDRGGFQVGGGRACCTDQCQRGRNHNHRSSPKPVRPRIKSGAGSERRAQAPSRRAAQDAAATTHIR